MPEIRKNSSQQSASGKKRSGPNHACLFTVPRCNARTWAVAPCGAPCLSGKSRCLTHDGAKGSSEQPDNTNAFKHGFYAGSNRAHVAELCSLISDFQCLLSTFNTPNRATLPHPSRAWARSRNKHKRSKAPSCKPKLSNMGRKGRSRMAARRSPSI